MNLIDIKESIADRIHFGLRSLRYFWQRRTRGWDDSDTWSLDYTIAKFTLPRLRRLKDIQHRYPGGLTESEWDDTLDRIIWSLEYILSDRWNDDIQQQILNDSRCQDGLDMFGKYFRALWD